MRPEFIVGDRRFWSRSEWIFLILVYWLCIVCILKEFFLLRIFFNVSFKHTNKLSIIIGIFHRIVFSYGYSKRTEFILVWLRAIIALGGAQLNASVFLLKYLGLDPCLWLFWKSCSLDEFLLTNNDPLKEQVSNFLSCWINNYLTTL